MEKILRKGAAYILNRAKEPSSWAGLSGFALTAGISEPAFAVGTTAVAGVAGLLAFILKEQPKS